MVPNFQFETRMNESIAGTAKHYLLKVANEYDFTRALPHADIPESPKVVEKELSDALAKRAGKSSELEFLGTQAIFIDRLDLAAQAFAAATDIDVRDWRAPYLQGMIAQLRGDSRTAGACFAASLERAQRPEAETSLAILELSENNIDSASLHAQHAVEIDGSYEPARFTAGMLALMRGDRIRGDYQLRKAIELGGAPTLTTRFLSAVENSSAAPTSSAHPNPAGSPTTRIKAP
jgi:hypothetical protein